MNSKNTKAKAVIMEMTIVDSEPSVVALIDYLDHLPIQPPSIYLDIEGVNLSRHGSISIIQIFVPPKNHVFLIDVFVLQEKAFCTSNSPRTNLRSILESAQVPKVFFDVRNDSDALFAHFNIALQGVQDVQLLEVATRSYSKDKVTGLAMCIEKDAQLTPEASAAWKATKQKGRSKFAPEHGGSYEVFNVRPMLHDIIEYCTQDVVYLPLLWKIYTQKISVKWMRKVQDKTFERIQMSHEASYEPNSRDKVWTPWAKPAKSNRSDLSGKTGTNRPDRTMTTIVPTPSAITVHSKWTCTTCCRDMQEDQKEDHLAGKPHIARVKRTVTAPPGAAYHTGTAKEQTSGATTFTSESLRTRQIVTEPILGNINPV